MTPARPPDPENDCAPDGRTSEARGETTAGTAKNSTRHRWQVQIVNPATGKPETFNTYDSRKAAELEAAKLRTVKMFAQVRRVDDDPFASRRTFLILACMAGWIKPERLTERIVDELEQEVAP